METDYVKINFGKYKDCDVACLLQDSGYVSWLLAQAWFERSHPDVYKTVKKKLASVVVDSSLTTKTSLTASGNSDVVGNNSTKIPGQSQPTPQHNRLQNRFLDPEYSCNFYKLVTGLAVSQVKVVFEAQHNWDVVITPCNEEIKSGNNYSLSKVRYPTLYIELKTTVGDEYPCVLRKMKEQIRGCQTVLTQAAYAIYIRTYKGESATVEQLKAIFKQEFDIQLIVGQEVESK